MGLQPTQRDEKFFGPATTFLRNVAPPFVIPSEAEGSAVLRTFHGNVFDKATERRQMELLEFDYPSATRRVTRKAHVGVVGSGDMEVLMEPAEKDGAHVSIRTSVNGFGGSWKAVLDRFFSRFDGAVRIYINDAGATPGSVMLRLEQAVEVIEA
jgi:malonate decarboxylase delta subunit